MTIGWILVGVAIGVVFAAWRQTRIEAETEAETEDPEIVRLEAALESFAMKLEIYAERERVSAVARLNLGESTRAELLEFAARELREAVE